jgi:hypothetical protein
LPDPLAAVRRLAACGLIASAGCSGEKAEEVPGARLEVQWVGGDTGKLVAPVEAQWCDSLRMLELRAMRGDTGIALVLYPRDSVAPGSYPLVPPEQRDSLRPAAAVALRWFEETEIRGFRGDSGSVSLTSLGPGVGSGRFGARVRATGVGTQLTVTGTFRGLTISLAPTDCAGTGVDPDASEHDPNEEFRETPD